MASLKELKTQFLEYIEIEKGVAQRTSENYDLYLTRFVEYAEKKGVNNPAKINLELVREFRIWLNSQPAKKRNKKDLSRQETMSRKTQNYYMTALRMFLKYLSKRDIVSMSSDKIELAKLGDRALDLITREELERLLEAPLQNKSNDLKAFRDKAILEVLFSTGLRVGELCSLSRNLNASSEELSIRGKGGKIRVVFISPRAREALKKYLALRKDMEEGLFVSIEPDNLAKNKKDLKDNKKYKGKEYGSLDRRSIERIVRHYATVAGIAKKVTPHVIRHCFATDLLQNGADIRSVQALLGHSSIITTQIYTHVTDKHLLEVHKKFHNKN
jgi:site-specific recombinase XerD